MKNDNYVVVQGWMCNELELKGNELLIFALIYGFSQDGESYFTGSRKYISTTFNISLPTVDKALEGLVSKQFIIKNSKNINGVTHNSYAVNLQDVKKLYGGSKETLLGGSKETLLNNISNNKTNIKNKSNSKELLQNQPTFKFGKNKSKETVSLYAKCISMIDDFTTDSNMRKLLITYLRYRLEVKDKPLYVNMWKGMLAKLNRDFDASERMAVIQQSIDRGYLSFYPVSSVSSRQNVFMEGEGLYGEQYTQEELEEIKKHADERERNGKRGYF